MITAIIFPFINFDKELSTCGLNFSRRNFPQTLDKQLKMLPGIQFSTLLQSFFYKLAGMLQFFFAIIK